VHVYDLFVGCHVFSNKDDAIKLIKEKKGGRFKAFNKRIEAEEFSVNVSAHNCSTHAIETVAVFVLNLFFYCHLHSLLPYFIRVIITTRNVIELC